VWWTSRDAAGRRDLKWCLGALRQAAVEMVRRESSGHDLHSIEFQDPPLHVGTAGG
jgi:hypothetical protein